MSAFEKVAEGFIYNIDSRISKQIASCPRCAVTNDGEIVCTYFVQKSLGLNDYEMMHSRSCDGGETWKGCGLIWPHLHGKYSTCCSISRSISGELFLYGIRTPIDYPDEPNWCEATQGLKQNELIFSRSIDNGHTWSNPSVIPMPAPGAAEAPGAMCLLKSGRWIAPYSPYNTFDPDAVVERNQVIAVFSDDRGMSWKHSSMLRFDDVNSNGAEAWIVELTDGRLLGTSWHLNQNDGSDYPNAYALSYDGGVTWTKTCSTGIMGQSTALAALKDGRALFIYNQRKFGDIGVWLAVMNPTETDFGVESNEIVWRAQTNTQSGLTRGEHSEWMDFSFGEPSVIVLPDDTLLVALWCIQPEGSGIKYIKLKMT